MALRVRLPDERVRVEGAVDVDVTGDGIVARRLASRYRHQFPLEVEFLASSPSGVRLAFATDAPTVELEVLVTHVVLGDELRPAVFETAAGTASTTVGHRLVIDPVSRAMDFVVGEPTTVTLDVPAGGGAVEVWLPHSSVVEVRSLTIDDGASLDAAPPDALRRWVHHGSSISHCLEADVPTATWPAVAAAIGDVHLTNLGLAGQCHLDQFTARTIRDLPADVLSLKCGINVVNGDTLRLRTFPAALHGFLDTVRDGHPDTPLLVVSPICCPAHEDTAGPTERTPDGAMGSGAGPKAAAQGALTLRQIRELVAGVVEARQKAGDPNIAYWDGLELFGPDDVADLPDGLHPNAAGYRRMGERFAAHAFASGGPLHLS